MASNQDRGSPARSGPLYRSYDDVPFYRKQWVFWILYFLLNPIALGILVFGDVYYERDGMVKSFGVANRILAGLFGLFVLFKIFR